MDRDPLKRKEGSTNYCFVPVVLYGTTVYILLSKEEGSKNNMYKGCDTNFLLVRHHHQQAQTCRNLEGTKRA